MPRIPKIVYLFGAGATHSELQRLDETLVGGNVQDEKGLLMGHVSRRVFKKAQKINNFHSSILDIVTTPGGAENIELFITLLENNSTNGDLKGAAEKAKLLREFVEEDITDILTEELRERFLLHRVFFELHQKTTLKDREELIGVLSLNYDIVLDEAYRSVCGDNPNYAFPRPDGGDGIPLLKLHGSFGWDTSFWGEGGKKIPIMPLGINKNYLQLPYNYIWGSALELMVRCDTLRIIGCSLSPNDVQLVELLFKSHLARQEPFTIDIINRQSAGIMFKSNYDFLPRIRLPQEVESEARITGMSGGKDYPFEAWLKGVGDKLPEKEVRETKYLKDLI